MHSPAENVNKCIAKGCHPKLIAALTSFGRKQTTSHTTTSRRWSVWALFGREVAPTFIDLLIANAAAGTDPLLHAAEFVKLVARRDTPLAADDLLKRMHRHSPASFQPTLETMRNLLFYIRGCTPRRGTPPELRLVPHAPKRTLRRKLPSDWDGTYCVLCWRLTAYAQSTESGQNSFEEASSGQVSWASSRFCTEHTPGSTSSSYRRDHAYREEFAKTVKQLWLALNRHDRWRVLNERLEVIATNLPAYSLRGSLSAYNPTASYLRWWAYCVVRFRPSDLAISARRLQLEGVSQADIARDLGVSRQAVSKMLQRIRGVVDVSAPDPILSWIPEPSSTPSIPLFAFTAQPDVASR